MTEAEFRLEYAPFADVGTYSSARVQRWLERADRQITARVWDDDTRQWAIGLWTAHNIVLEQAALQQAENGGLPVGTSGRVTSQSVGGVSVSMNLGSIDVAGAGSYNATSYGQQFYQLLQMAGAGGGFVG
jgi:hypothetical protein